MLDKLRELQDQALRELEAVSDTQSLEQWHTAHLGKKSALNQVLRSVGQLPKEERPIVGQRGNEVKLALEAAYEQRVQVLKAQEMARALAEESVDVTLPGRPVSLGRLHPSTQALREIYAIFAAMGFQVYTAPEVETDELNFGLLNMPPHHPARDMWDTFYTTRPGVLLRTHTSPGQIRVMRERCPEPIRVILPGKCYRYEQVTARSEHQFYQVEGLAVGRRITLTDLKGTMAEYARRAFGVDRKMRFRGSYFPFTEPSVEVDMDCIICGGAGCRVCKYSGWLEIAGAGMVHPQVLRNGGYNPQVYSGFAFGMGVERPMMLKCNIDDIRYFYSNDIRFLQQFG